MSEIVTLQLGRYANYVGSHFWNLQESNFVYDNSAESIINHDVLFREGVNLSGQTTFTPRLVVCDRRSHLGSLRAHGSLYEDSQQGQDSVSWLDAVTLHQKEKLPRHEFLKDAFDNQDASTVSKDNTEELADKFDESIDKEKADVKSSSIVQYWSDYLGLHLHHKSVLPISDCCFGPEVIQPFVNGTSLLDWKSSSGIMEELETRLHSFVEECDSMQGFMVLHESHTAFSGVFGSLLHYLRDEYSSKKCITSMPCLPADLYSMESDNSAVLNWMSTFNLLFSLSKSHSFGDLCIPLSTSYSPWNKTTKSNHYYQYLTEFDPCLDYHSSSLLATTIDNLTFPLRQKRSCAKISFYDLADLLSVQGRNIALPSLALPFPLMHKRSISHTFNQYLSSSISQSVNPFLKSNLCSPLTLYSVSRGLSNSRIVDSIREKETAFLLRDIKSIDALMNQYYRDTFSNVTAHHLSNEQPMRLKSPYPAYFTRNLVGGEIIPGSYCLSTNDNGLPASVPVLANLHSSSTAPAGLVDLLHHCRSLPRHLSTTITGDTLEQADIDNLLEDLSVIIDRYSADS